jgi:hypothetical protein
MRQAFEMMGVRSAMSEGRVEIREGKGSAEKDDR